MHLPIVIATYNRLELLKQTLTTLRLHSDNELEIIVVDDASTDPNVFKYLKSQKDIEYLRLKQRIQVAEVKNQGIALVSPSKYICIVDDDMYFLPHWDTVLIQALETYSDILLIGGKPHPHHTILEKRPLKINVDNYVDNFQVLTMNTQPGYCFFMERKTLNQLHFMEAHSEDIYGHEDTVICDKIHNMNKKVASINPPVLYHCGATNLVSYAADYPEMMAIAKQHPEIKFL